MVVRELYRQMMERRSGEVTSADYEPIKADPDLFEQLKNNIPDAPLIKVRPPKESPGLQHGINLIQSLYNVREDHLSRNISHTHTFEMWYDEGQLSFVFSPERIEDKDRFEHHVKDKYPNARIETMDKTWPTMEPGDFIAGGEMGPREPYYLPMQMVEVPDLRVSGFDRDPYGGLTSEMVIEEEFLEDGTRVDSDEARAVVQVCFTPAKRDWAKGGLFDQDVDDIADTHKNEKLKGSTGQQVLRAMFGKELKTREASSKERDAARLVSKMRGRPGFYVRIRVLVISPFREIARRHAHGISEQFEQYYNAKTEQGLKKHPVERSDLRDLVIGTGSRTMEPGSPKQLDQRKFILSQPEMAGVVHLPNASINTPNVDWTRLETGSGVPPETPQMEDIEEEAAEARADDGDDEEEFVTFDSDNIGSDDYDLSYSANTRASDGTPETKDGDPLATTAVPEENGAEQATDGEGTGSDGNTLRGDDKSMSDSSTLGSETTPTEAGASDGDTRHSATSSQTTSEDADTQSDGTEGKDMQTPASGQSASTGTEPSEERDAGSSKRSEDGESAEDSDEEEEVFLTDENHQLRDR